MELFEIDVDSKYQEVIEDHEPITADTITIDQLEPLGFSGGDDDFELFQETLAEFSGSATATITAAQLQETVRHSRYAFPDAWRGNWAVLVDSGYGVYCPQVVGRYLTSSQVKVEGVTKEDLQILQAGPENGCYWHTWGAVLNSCVIHAESERFCLIHDEDVFLVPID